MALEPGELELQQQLVAPAVRERVWTRARREVWRFLPAWMFFLYGWLLLNTGLTNFSPPRADLAWLAVFPLGVFVTFYAVRAAFSNEVKNRVGLFLGVSALAVGLPLLTVAFHRPSPLTGSGLLVVYEVSNFFWAAMMLSHAWFSRKSHAFLFFGAGFLYGLLLENGGIVLGYFHETNLKITEIPPLKAPFATMIGWCVVLYMATFVVWQLRKWLPVLQKSALLSGVLVAISATLLDLQIDPHATAAGAWVWDETLPPFFHGVPLVNFVAWMCALYPFSWAMFRHQQRAAIADGGAWSKADVLAMVRAVPGSLIIAALSFLTAMGLLEGFSGPSWQIFNRFTLTLFAAIGF